MNPPFFEAETADGLGARRKGESAFLEETACAKARSYWKAHGPKGNSAWTRPRLRGGPSGSWGWDAWPRLLVKVWILSYKQPMLTEQGSDIISLIFWYESSGGTVDNGLEDTGGRETHSRQTVPSLVCCTAGPAASLAPPWAKVITDKLTLSVSELRPNISFLKCERLVSVLSLITLPLGAAVIISCLIFIEALNYIQVITTVL